MTDDVWRIEVSKKSSCVVGQVHGLWNNSVCAQQRNENRFSTINSETAIKPSHCCQSSIVNDAKLCVLFSLLTHM